MVVSADPENLRLVVVSIGVSHDAPPSAATLRAVEMLDRAQFRVVRRHVVRPDEQFIRELMRAVGGENEADAVLVLGTGFGPKDVTCEALERDFAHKIEGFGESVRRIVDLGRRGVLKQQGPIVALAASNGK